jgi:hypothetical protein
MGILRQDTTNIEVDAVITTVGSQFLARGDFSIYSFSLGDDEIDYGIIEQYGQTVGREKIEKNTPVFEALRNPSLALRSNLISLSNPNQLYLPVLSVNAGALTTTNYIEIARQSSININLTQAIQEGAAQIPSEIVDNLYIVFVNRLFLNIANQTPVNSDTLASNPALNTARYEITSGSPTANFSLVARSIPAATFNTYSAFSKGDYIKTYMRIIGRNSGITKDIEVRITS